MLYTYVNIQSHELNMYHTNDVYLSRGKKKN